MKTLKSFAYVLVYSCLIIFWGACTQAQKANDEESMEHTEESGEDHDQDHDHDMESSSMEDHAEADGDGESYTWVFGPEDEDPFAKSFHFVVGNKEDLNATVTDNAITLNPASGSAAFVLHKKFENVGGQVEYMLNEFKGDFKFVYHFNNEENHEFVWLNGNNMKLGRIVDGEEEIFEENKFEFDPNEWTTLKFSAAGTHFKGYIGGATITHGHADEMEPGYVGIWIDGAGTLTIRSLEVVILEEEEE